MILSGRQLKLLARILTILSLTIWLLVPTVASAEVRVIDGKIVMEQSDFRKLMGDLAEAEAERDALRYVLDVERQSQDDYMVQVNQLRAYFDDEREAWKDSVLREKERKPLWGIIGLGIGLAIR